MVLYFYPCPYCWACTQLFNLSEQTSGLQEGSEALPK